MCFLGLAFGLHRSEAEVGGIADLCDIGTVWKLWKMDMSQI